MPKVSIVIPVYNNSELIIDALRSVKEQTFKDFEVIIVDDGSKDNTVKVINNYIDENNLRNYYLYKKKNGGPSSARNYGINESKGEYIMFLDSDDLYDKRIVEKLYGCIKNKNKNTVVLCGIKKISNDEISTYKTCEYNVHGKKELGKLLEILQYNQIFNSSCNKIFSREVLEEYQILFDEELEMGEDFKFNLDYYKQMEHLVVLPVALYNYRIDHSQVSNTIRENDFDKRKKNIEVLKKYYLDLGIDKNLDFQYIKIFYSEIFNEMENKKHNKNIKIRKIIRELLLKNEIIELKNNYKPNKLYMLLLYVPIKTGNISLIYMLAIMMNKVRKKNISRRKGISI